MFGLIVPFPIRPAAHACDSYQGAWGSAYCGRCCWARSAHQKHAVGCSQCGRDIYVPLSQETGFSHCIDHQRKVR